MAIFPFFLDWLSMCSARVNERIRYVNVVGRAHAHVHTHPHRIWARLHVCVVLHIHNSLLVIQYSTCHLRLLMGYVPDWQSFITESTVLRIYLHTVSLPERPIQDIYYSPGDCQFPPSFHIWFHSTKCGYTCWDHTWAQKMICFTMLYYFG